MRKIFFNKPLSFLTLLGVLCQPLVTATTATTSDKPMPQSQSTIKRLPLTANIGYLVLDNENAQFVETKFGKVICARHSVAFIFQGKTSLAIFVLDAKKADDVKISFGPSSAEEVNVSPGHELVVSKLPGAKFTDENPKLGILFRSAKAQSAAGDKYIFSAEFMIEKAIQKISGLRELSMSEEPVQRKLLHRILKNAAALQPTAKQELADRQRLAQIRNAQPCPFNPAVLRGGVQSLEQSRLSSKAKVIDLTMAAMPNKKNDDDQDIHWLKETNYDWSALAARDYSSQQRSILLTCSADCLIKTETSFVFCKRGTKLFIDNHDAFSTVCTLDSNRPKDVVVSMPGQSVGLPTGCALLLRKQGRTVASASPAHLISYRSWSEKKTAADVDYYGADFSVHSAVYALQPLREMMQSHDPKKRAKVRVIIKNATILAHIDPGGPYQW